MNVPLTTSSVGSLAGLCTTLSWVPQLRSVLKRKSAQDISMGMFLVFGLGVLLWLTYGIEIRSAPVIIANGTTLALVLVILALKIHYERKQ
jgi:MtN3 and saliva related transmembrane protein